MTPNHSATRQARWLARCAAVAACTACLSVPTQAQQAAPQAASGRLEKLEAEVRALQRKVFPGGDGRYFEPEISTPGATGAAPVPSPATTTALTDVLTRMDALETQMQRLTAQVEQNTNRLNQIEAKLAAQVPPAAQDGGPAPIGPAPIGPASPGPTGQVGASFAPPPAANLAATTGGAGSAARPTAGRARPGAAPARPAVPSAARVQAVKAIARPQTDDPGDDEYSYGFRLWEAKFYPEAEQQLQSFLQKYPKHARAGWGRNLLGRAYLDDGNPTEAAKWFWQNYLADKRGDRAADSLLYLAVAMKQINDSSRACIALAEFTDTYAAEAAGRLKSLYDSTRNGLACS